MRTTQSYASVPPFGERIETLANGPALDEQRMRAEGTAELHDEYGVVFGVALVVWCDRRVLVCAGHVRPNCSNARQDCRCGDTPVGEEVGDAMSFDKWPKFMVLPEAKDFKHGAWETECGTRGCAYGWLCTAFGVESDSSGMRPMFPPCPVGSPAATFAASLIRELGGVYEGEDPKYELSDAFEWGYGRGRPTEQRMADAWARAAKYHGYVPMGRFR